MTDTRTSNVDIDENVLAKLPEGVKVLSISPSGASAWVQTVRIDTQLADGTSKTYFKKGAIGDRGREMMRGTFQSEQTLYAFAPSNVPKPLAWGTYKQEPDSHFYMCDFYDMTDDLPDIARFCTVVAKMHLDSMGKSPNGQYGFHVTTHLAYVDNDNSWSDSWEEWYGRALKRMLREEEKSHGPDDELKVLTNAMFEKVIPRLLRPLETGGRQIKPCLIHSDLWPGNVKPDAETDEPIIFDSYFTLIFDSGSRLMAGSALPAWAAIHDRISQTYQRYDLLHSALFPKEPKFRKAAMDEMRHLVDKYPEGYAGFGTQLGGDVEDD
ncbi:MAG: hypothetical protein Q9188_001921 [Gyalolechia gomerana]